MFLLINFFEFIIEVIYSSDDLDIATLPVLLTNIILYFHGMQGYTKKSRLDEFLFPAG
jgi:ribulose 1,5-bisphosphate carboxylase large subunit-like protein